MIDTITLPRSVVEQALESLKHVQEVAKRHEFLTMSEYRCITSGIEPLRAALEQPPVVEQVPDEFYEWWRMRPSLTRLQAWLLWKEQV